MRKKIVKIAVVISLFLTVGCAKRVQQVNFQYGDPGMPEIVTVGEKDVITKTDGREGQNGMTFFDTGADSHDALELANAYAVMKDADTRYAMMQKYSADTNQRTCVGVVVNDSRHSVYVPHPELHQKIFVKSGGNSFFIVKTIPDTISFYSVQGEFLGEDKWVKNNKPYNGIQTCFGYRIQKITLK